MTDIFPNTQEKRKKNSLSAIVRDALLNAGIKPSQFATELERQGFYCARNTQKMLSLKEHGNPTPLLIIKAGEHAQDPYLFVQVLQQSALGAKVLNKPIEKKPVEQPAIALHLMGNSMPAISQEILEVIADGIVDEEERPRYEKCIEFLDDLRATCLELKYAYEARK